jgi:choline dehydrogenase-like flavoprotein
MPVRRLPSDMTYDLVVIGSGFGALFFLEGYLAARPNDRVLVLERGAYRSHAWQIEHATNSLITPSDSHKQPDGQKPWNYTIGFGGGTNCWYGQAPRFHPTDFKLHSRYGVGQDWPLDYDELEPFYVRAEQHMSVSGSEEMGQILPRSAPFPQPPHRMSAVDRVMRRAQPEFHFPIATARSRVPTPTRAVCCSSARCHLCPVDAKFTANNGFQDLLNHPGVDVVLHAEVTHLEHRNAVVHGATFRKEGRERTARGELFVLGANAIHSPAILIRSGLNRAPTGSGLHEQVGIGVEAFLDGLDNFDGSTLTTGLNYALYDGPFRAEHGGALVYFENRWPYGLRPEPGRWRQILPLVLNIEDLPLERNHVTVDLADGMAYVDHPQVSAYAERGIKAALARLEGLLAPLPVERIEFRQRRSTESHILGTLRMGTDPVSSVIDAGQVHHDVRNLVVVGSAVCPSCSCANPSLTVAALSLRAADRLFA